MADIQEIKEQTYLEFVQELLNCSQGEEADILIAKPELLNQQLVETMLGVAQMLRERKDRNLRSNALWLEKFALKLAELLGLKGDNGTNADAQLLFLMQVMESIKKSGANPEIVYSLLQQNLVLLNDEIIEILKIWGHDLITEAEGDIKKFVGRTFWEFGKLL